jgi:hypothetical protein
MAEDDIDDEEFDETLDVEEIDEDDLEADEEDPAFVEPDELVEADAEVVEEEEVVEPAPKAKKKREDEEDEDEEVDPDDVEADLDTILKDRIAANEDEEEEEDLEEQEPRTAGETADGVQPKKANEFMCTGCFLLVNAAQFGPPGHLECPVGESVCPALAQVEKQYQKARR